MKGFGSGRGPRPRRDGRFYLPVNAIAESLPRRSASLVNTCIMTTSRLRMTGVELRRGDLVTNVHYISGNSGATTPTNQWAALFDSNGIQLGVSADKTTEAWASSTAKSFPLTTPYRVPTDGLYFAGLVIVAAGLPTFYGSATAILASTSLMLPMLSFNADTGLSTPATCPADVDVAAGNGITVSHLYSWIT